MKRKQNNFYTTLSKPKTNHLYHTKLLHPPPSDEHSDLLLTLCIVRPQVQSPPDLQVSHNFSFGFSQFLLRFSHLGGCTESLFYLTFTSHWHWTSNFLFLKLQFQTLEDSFHHLVWHWFGLYHIKCGKCIISFYFYSYEQIVKSDTFIVILSMRLHAFFLIIFISLFRCYINWI